MKNIVKYNSLSEFNSSQNLYPKVSLVKDNNKLYIDRGVFMTDATNPEAMAVCFNKGLSKSKNEMLRKEASKHRIITNEFMGSNIIHFDEFKYFDGVQLPTKSQEEFGNFCLFGLCHGLKSVSLPRLNETTDMSEMFADCTSLTSIDLSKLDTRNVTNMMGMFTYCTSLTSIDLSKLDTRNVTNMMEMFVYCSSLTSIDLSKLDTRNVTNMMGMFGYCTSLTSIDLSKLDTRNVNDMSYMFAFCTSLTTIPILDTSKVTNMNSMFSGCTSLTSIDLSKLDTRNVTNMMEMFYGCTSLNKIYFNNDLSKLNNCTDIFSGISSTGEFIIPNDYKYGEENYKKIIDFLPSGWIIKRSDVEVIEISSLNILSANDCTSEQTTTTVFYEAKMKCFDTLSHNIIQKTIKDSGISEQFEKNLDSKDREILITFKMNNKSATATITQYCKGKIIMTSSSNPEAMAICHNQGWASNADSMTIEEAVSVGEIGTAFAGRYVYTNANDTDTYNHKLKHFDEFKYFLNAYTELGKSFKGSFYNVKNSSITLPSLSNSTKMNEMFRGNHGLINFNKLDTSNVNSMYCMFNDCISLVTIPRLDTSNVTDMHLMFNHCINLTNIQELDTSNVINMEGMFKLCISLTNIPELNISNVTNMMFMFASCTSLKEIRFKGNPLKVNEISGMFDDISETGTLYYDYRYDYSKIINELKRVRPKWVAKTY